MMEVDRTLDIAREQRRAEARAVQSGWQARVVCGSLAREICSRISQRAEVHSWINSMLEDGDPGKGGMEDDAGQSARTDEGAWHDGKAGERDCREGKSK